jgi:hypothetical protein
LSEGNSGERDEDGSESKPGAERSKESVLNSHAFYNYNNTPSRSTEMMAQWCSSQGLRYKEEPMDMPLDQFPV